ncbi:LAME_0G02454g1_1 [Lachancea meyersii CBS 8951]|uniref:DNA polymerase epsilon catalytic subunit n=1 Tax=Lachancea meyersii CBS 8951 TaxID=1266667 RepID=A0A1G4K5Y4_9SACH|nr:LAME_0G02454g1_1 [Lachancea meyersii CBS 8951]
MSGRFQGSNTAKFVKNTGNGRSKNPQQTMVNSTAQQLIETLKKDEIDTMMGFERYIAPQFSGRIKNWQETPGRVGWLVNMHPTMVSEDFASSGSNGGLPSTGSGISGVDFYFLDEEGGGFKSTLTFDPYFLVACRDESRVHDVEEFLKKHLEHCLKKVETVVKNDLSLGSPLAGLNKVLLKLTFSNTSNLFEARRTLRPIILDNETNHLQRSMYSSTSGIVEDTKRLISDIREYDVPFHVRVAIDNDVRVGKWYKVTSRGFLEVAEKVAFADPVVLAFDIETTKAPLKFPIATVDQIMMISYMIDGEGYLITNREIISEDIEDFEYSPKPEYPGFFTIFNEADELALLERFFEHIRDVRPTVISTFNGDFFDWPFVETRAKINGLDMFQEIGFAVDSEGEYKSTYCAHMDCFRWVKRDSYLPQGSQGLKAVTQAKLGYNPIELDPELMTPYAYEKPQLLSEYSVSDAVATYYLYMKYVHPFVFSLCTIIPLNPDEVLRKGTGTLCEMLLTVQAYKGDILLPNKHTDPIERFYDGHLLESETYVGGHVESLEAGVFRSDIKNDFKIDPEMIDDLLNDLPHALKFCVEVENNCKLEDVTNYEEIEEQIKNQLVDFKTNTKRNEFPLIYHVDVASMYPNIMITNRLQPDSVKSDRDCAGCDFNRPGKACDRKLQWSWRGEYFPSKMDEYSMVKRALQNETFSNKNKKSFKKLLSFEELSYSDQVAHIKKRLTEYSRKVYHRVKSSEVVERTAIICQRENPFYVNTVRSFRDRRYEFKGLAKTWKQKHAAIDSDQKHERDEAKKMIILYDSLQLAHKVILNSFYGYVMRKGSRWYSMEMAGITCLTGATIIQMARSVVEKIGRPLELDTDGIWCIIPQSFPDNYQFKLKNGKKLFLSYPCSMLNYKVHQKFTNHQYQNLVDPVNHRYEIGSDNSIFFEVDGPYKAMVLPTSKEEGKGIKKRYAVFNNDGSLAELKGFELKRRGELQLIKNFQSDIFKVFLDGDSLEGCYASVALVANRWLDVLDSKGVMLEDEDLIDLICENRSMSKTLKEYEGQKSTSITTAKRLGEFLGEEMVKDKGLQCKYIISSRPVNAPVTERAIPVAIFSADLSLKRVFLRRWLVDSSLENFDPRAIIDWEYYRERLASVVQKIITIPAALQNVKNPVPRVEHPEWLRKKIATSEDKFKQASLNSFFKKATPKPALTDIEEAFKEQPLAVANRRVAKVTSKRSSKRKTADAEEKEAALVLPSVMPSMTEDYVAWLSYQKIKWKIQDRDRQRRTQLFGDRTRANQRSALGNIMRKHAESYANSTWEILEYKETLEPGVLDVSVLLNGKVHKLKFIIPKSVYINFKSKTLPVRGIENCTVEKSTALLPNNATASFEDPSPLFKLTLSEDSYLQETSRPSSLFNHDQVLGIYESSITSAERAILELGSVVEFDSSVIGALGKGLQKGFDPKNLHPVSPQRYLNKFSISVGYLLHMTTNLGYEFFVSYKSWNSEADIFVLKPSTNAQEFSVSALQSIFKELHSQKSEKLDRFYDLMKIPSNFDIKMHSFIDLRVLYRKLSSMINKINEEKGSQLLMLLSSPYCQKLRHVIKPLRQIPTVEMSSAEAHFPQLNWQVPVMKRISNHILSLGSWLHNLISLSRYSNIPICNIRLDKMSFVIDVMYARSLKKSNIVLWWNDVNPIPDLGGKERDFDPHMASLMSDLDLFVINSPSIYDSVTLEFEMSNLTVNTVLTSAVINEAEGSDLMEVDNSSSDVLRTTTNKAFVEDSFASASLSVLRALLKTFWDSALEENETADSLVHTFIHWVQSPDSKLFDYALKYHVHNLTKKAILQLMNVCKNLGSEVVYADRGKLLLKTKKITVESCYAYSQYIVKAIRTSPLFGLLDLSIRRYWDLLLWIDPHNFGGRACIDIVDQERQDLRAYSEWHIKSFLPRIYQQEFDDWMMVILDSMVKSKEEYHGDNRDSQRLTQLSREGVVLEKDEEESGVLTGFTNRFGSALIKRMEKLLRTQKECILDPNFMPDYTPPVLPGSHLKIRNPLLELVKYLCHIMLLSEDHKLEVRGLRKSLLKVFEVREFDWEAEFKNPSSSLEVSNLACEHCSFITDLDFCKQDSVVHLSCEQCRKPFNPTLLQEYLIQTLQIDLQNYYMQDLRCAKCGKVKDDLMSAHCPCSGSWKNSISEKDLTQKLTTYQRVARYFEFELLSSTINELVTGVTLA